jgi:serine/threonine protein phosphatase PrpC
VKAQGHSIDQYDTTLSLAVFINDTLYYGHSGDSGIVALTTEGLYEKVTEQQRDDDNRVFPLFFEDKWVFGRFDRKVCSIFLATDGMLETLFPFLIRNESVKIHVNLAQFFMDNRSLCIDKEGESAVKGRIEEFIRNIPDEQVNDDKTVVVLISSSIEPKSQPNDYYKEPDWAELKRRRDEEWKREAYPHLFKNAKTEIPLDSSSNDNTEKSLDNDTVIHDAGQNNTDANNTADKPKKKGGFWSFLRGNW